MSKKDFDETFGRAHPDLMPRLEEIDNRSRACYEEMEGLSKLMREYAENGVPLAELADDDSVVIKTKVLQETISDELPQEDGNVD